MKDSQFKFYVKHLETAWQPTHWKGAMAYLNDRKGHVKITARTLQRLLAEGIIEVDNDVICGMTECYYRRTKRDEAGKTAAR